MATFVEEGVWHDEALYVLSNTTRPRVAERSTFNVQGSAPRGWVKLGEGPCARALAPPPKSALLT